MSKITRVLIVLSNVLLTCAKYTSKDKPSLVAHLPMPGWVVIGEFLYKHKVTGNYKNILKNSTDWQAWQLPKEWEQDLKDFIAKEKSNASKRLSKRTNFPSS